MYSPAKRQKSKKSPSWKRHFGYSYSYTGSVFYLKNKRTNGLNNESTESPSRVDSIHSTTIVTHV